MKNSVIFSFVASICVFVCSAGIDITGYHTTLQLEELKENHLKYFLIGQIAENLGGKGLAFERTIKMFTKLLYNKRDDFFNSGYSRLYNKEFGVRSIGILVYHTENEDKRYEFLISDSFNYCNNEFNNFSFLLDNSRDNC